MLSVVEYLSKCPSPQHCVKTSMDMLAKAGYTIIKENDEWKSKLQAGGKQMFTRSESTLITFKLPAKMDPENLHFKVIGGHTDSPVLKLRPNSKSGPKFNVHQLAVSPQGGGLWNTWFDRDLTIAGKVFQQDGDKVSTKLVHIDKPSVLLPNMCIHLRDANDRDFIKFDRERHLKPICSLVSGGNKFEEEQLNKHWKDLLQLVCKEAGIEVEHFLNFDLNLLDATKPSLLGLNDEFLVSGRLDNQSTCQSMLRALVETANDPEESITMAVFQDNEEIGSETTQGAQSRIQLSTLQRVLASFAGENVELFERAIRRSFVVSCDAAHAVHPNYSSQHELEGHAPVVGKGLVLKKHMAMRQATDPIGETIFRDICNSEEKHGKCLYQEFLVNNNTGCGGTIGSMTASLLGIRTIDVGAPIWAMHSIRESMAVGDIDHMTLFMKKFITSYNWKKQDVSN